MSNKACTKCKITQPLDNYHNKAKAFDGHAADCKTCVAARRRKYREENRELVNAQKREWYANNREDCIKACRARYYGNHTLVLQQQKEYRDKNAQANRDRSRQWRKDNPWMHNALNAKRKATKLNATPPWLNDTQLQEIQDIYELCQEATNNIVESQVDHIVPLQHPLVCGLHVPWNLQILGRIENSSKGNRFEV